MHFLPPPLPDELLYSVIARYHSYSGNESYKNTARDLFGSKTVCAVTDFPCHLYKLSSRIPGMVISERELLECNTLLPYYKKILPIERIKQVEHEMIYGDGHSLYMKLGLPANGIKNNKYLKYCLICVDNDQTQHGVAYWHRAHQLPGVTVCHQHHVVLTDSGVTFSSRRNKHEYIPLEEMAFPGEVIQGEQIEIEFGKRSFEFLADCSIGRLDNLKEVYVSRLWDRQFISYSGRIKFQKLISSFTDFYGESFLERQGSYVSSSSQDSWLHKVMRKESYVIHPVRHILLHIFLDIPIHTILHTAKGNHKSIPFGEGPWLCLNRAAEHFEQAVITECKVTRCTVTGRPVGTFGCSCGFTYSRRGPDNSEADRYRIGRIKKFGDVWRGRLIELNKEGDYSLREQARILGVDPNTVKNQLKRLNDLKGKVIEVDFSKKQNIIMQKRQEWVALLSHPENNLSRRTLYMWLYRNDKEWLMLNKSPSTLRRPIESRINWEQRDKEIAEKIKMVVIELQTSRNIRITKGEIGRRIGKLSLIQNRLEKLPQTRNEIMKSVESTDKFRMRRVKSVQSEIYLSTLKDWKAAKMAGVNVKEYQRLVNS